MKQSTVNVIITLGCVVLAFLFVAPFFLPSKKNEDKDTESNN
jgi:hypothetical protein